MTNRQQMTGCQVQTTVFLLIICAIMVYVAYNIGHARTDSRCTVTGTTTSSDSWSSRGEVLVNIHLGNDEVIESVYKKTFSNYDDARAFTDQYLQGDVYPCGYNSWFPERVSFESGTVPTRHYFWFIISLTFVLGGFTLANMLNIIGSKKTPPGQHQPIRLRVDGGDPGAWLWFLVVVIAAFAGAIIAAFIVLRLRWQFWGETFWASAFLLVLCVVGCVLSIYWLFRQFYLLRTGADTFVEISEQPVSPGKTAEIFVSHTPGKLTVQQLKIKLICEKTTRERTRTRDGTTSYKYDSHNIYDATIYEEPDFQALGFKTWEKSLELPIPSNARPSTDGMNTYPQIRWWIAVKLTVPNMPDFTFEYVIEVG